MIKLTTISAKIKQNKSIKNWFSEQSKNAVFLYNECLNLQFECVNLGKKIQTAFDLAKNFRDYLLGSDYKDRIFERVADSTRKWIQSEPLRYKIYWNHKEKKQTHTSKTKLEHLEKYPWLHNISTHIVQHDDYKKNIQRLARKQKIIGKPRKRKNCSLAFSIRQNRQDTIQIKRNKLEFFVPKFKRKISGKYNFLPTSSKYQFKLGTLKIDSCGTLWIKLAIEEELSFSLTNQTPNKEKIIVGVDMGLKTTRTAVAINESRGEIVQVYSPKRQRFFDQSYHALGSVDMIKLKALL